MSDLTQFISCITDEAMQRICYSTTESGSGWTLKPFQFAVSTTDPLAGYSESQIFDEEGNVRPEIIKILRDVRTETLDLDLTNGVWCQLPYSGLTKANKTTITHHIVIPSNLFSEKTTKEIKTIYFIYKDQNGDAFLYALARATSYMAYETGVTQSFFFNFTVANSTQIDMTQFTVNYSYPLEIQDHDQNEDSHVALVKRDGSRSITGILKYDNIPVEEFIDDDQLIPKKYVDEYIQKSLLPLLNGSICPPGKIDWWPGLPDTIPEGWAVRNGQLLSIAENPVLYKILGQRYKNECRVGTSYDTAKYFPLMNDCGLFIRGSELSSGGSVLNDNLLNGVSFGGQQAGAVPNITGDAQFSQEWETWGKYPYSGAFYLKKRGGNGTDGTHGAFDIVGFDASRCNAVYKDGVSEVRPNNRNYLPFIKLG